jgi:acetoin utilization protein AcuB
MPDTTLLVADVMSSPPVVVRTHDSLWRAMDRFLATGLRHLVVLDESDVVIGVLDDRAVVSEWARDALGLHQRTVGALMRASATRTVAVTRETPVQEAARLMLERRVDALPVVGSDGRVVGVLTGSDLVRTVVKGQAGQPDGTPAPSGAAR